MKEVLVTGKHYRVLADAVNNIWHRISYWTKASDVQFNDGSYLEGKTFGHRILERSKEYSVDEIAYCTSAPSWVRLICIETGITGATEPLEYQTIINGDEIIEDGTAKFKIIDLRLKPSLENLSEKNCQIPAAALVKEVGDQVDSVQNKIMNVSLYVGNEGQLHYKNAQGEDITLDYNPHGANYTISGEDAHSIVDLGEMHKYQHINALGVYSVGYDDGVKQNSPNAKIVYYHHVHSESNTTTTDGGVTSATNATGVDDNAHIYSSTPKGCYTKPYYENRSERCPANAGYSRSSWTEQRPWTTPGYAGFYDNIEHVTKTCKVCGKSWEAENHDPDTPAHNRTVNKIVGYSIGCNKSRGQLVKQKITFN